ncbi:uncharacterized protein LOC142563880 isoform X3 [Dermacentor variabilis]|uniref:uncharacterized protein LOC142563880 isoform X3 n=1 Tax=Dermacentor variabilis TaxID=34621 RepID=UPI003F5B0183
MDDETTMIIRFVHVQVGESTDVKTSPHMEPAGLMKGFAYLKHIDLKVASLTTDRHLGISKYLRDHENDVNHELDSWHVAKGLIMGMKGRTISVCMTNCLTRIGLAPVSRSMTP